MRSNRSTCRAIAAGGAGFFALGLLALGLALGYLTSSNNPRSTTSKVALNNTDGSNSDQSLENMEELKLSKDEEYVIPMKKHHIPLHHMDVIYPHENTNKEDTHNSGHFRGRTAAIWDPHPQYEFTGFGKKFHLDLTQNEDLFVLPNLKVTHIWDNMTTQEEPNLRTGCFYTGTVRGDPGSAVSVNLCHGMTGHIKTSTGSYLIEPVETWQGYEKPLKHSLRRITLPMIHDHCHHHINDDHHQINEVDEALNMDEYDGNVNSNDSEDRSPRRTKRSLSEEYFIELMIVADNKMKEHHGNDLFSYVLTIMSVVSKIFKDASIGNRMTVALVNFSILQNQEYVLGKGNTNSSVMLTNFCHWQRKYNDPNDNSPQHHDTALLLTRENFCYEEKKDKCETLGLAELGTMCKPDRSCSLVKDNGLNAAFTIAHELGHVLNMPHDDDIKCKEYREIDKRNYVMARELNENTIPWNWSNCSRHFLTDFLDAGRGSCLRDPPSKDLLEEGSTTKGLPGELFNADKQCQLIYGPNYKVCRISENFQKCEKLWCQSHKDNKCTTQHMPRADGTPCHETSNGSKYDDGLKWCQKGRCVLRDRGVLKAVNGGWSQWQSYKECSRSCGGGVRQSIRRCNNPPPSNGGKYCIGQRIKYRSCATQECPPGTPDFREQQCAKYNNNNFKIQGLSENVTWVPKYGGITSDGRCKLFCRVADTSNYYELAEKVIDGTICGPESFDICVNGKCRKAGCDHVLNSSKELDLCGQCNGNPENCQRITGTYNQSQYGYTKIIRILAGSANIDIRQTGYNSIKDDNYLALIDSDTYNYILNGNFVVSMFEKRFVYGGTILQYSGSSETVERINSTRPLTKDLIVEVLSVGNMTPPNIVYEYYIQKRKYRWVLADSWSECNKLCYGKKHKTAKCIRIKDNQEVAEEHCDILNKPEIMTKPCNTFCALRWKVSDRSACSTSCGPGERTITLQCVQEDNLTGQITVVDNSSCQDILRPPTVEHCRGPCDKARWVYGTWSSCSVTCGDGFETRSASCMDHSGRSTSDSECDENEKEIQRPCWTSHCPVWQVGEWTPCSVTCGKGKKRRPFYCMIGNRTDNSLCPRPTPLDEKDCELDPCPYWITGEWSPCSVTCGIGEQNRSVVCSKENACSLETKPITTQYCVQQPCSFRQSGNYFWKETVTSCSVTCGIGRRTRYVTCQDSVTGKTVSDHLCPNGYAGDTSKEEVCEALTPCSSDHYDVITATWHASDWEPCSAICGTGFKKRTVTCRGLDGSHLADRWCVETKPAVEAECESPCIWNKRWTISDWSACSKSCGGGIRTRSVTCDYDVCSDVRPDSMEPCNMHSCIEGSWHYGSWSSCNVSCGVGYRHREIFCKSQSGVDLPERACKEKRVEITSEVCYGTNCGEPNDESRSPRWRASRWSPCSTRTCTQTRSIWCETAAGIEVSKGECAGKRIPKIIKPCKKRHCSPHITTYRKTPYIWKRGPWSQCHSNGEQIRTVVCIHVKGHQEIPVNEVHCRQRKPATRQWCTEHRNRNNDFHWKAGDWKPCNKQCSRKGFQERKLYCYLGDREVPRTNCKKFAAESKPEKRRRCISLVCTSCREHQLGLYQRKDGNYTMNIRGEKVTVYCHGMNTDNPKEYISLDRTNNFAMFYDRSIKEPEDGGNCHWDECGSNRYGLTFFNKIAINITSLTVIRDDFTFASRWKGSMIRYGEAGDCILSSGRRDGCRVQGEFQIDLQGTGFRIHPTAVWDNFGADIEIFRSHKDIRISGRCGGGCCGYCKPRDPFRLDLVPP